VSVLFSANVGEHVERNVSLATSAAARFRQPVGLTALRRTNVFEFEPGRASGKHAPTTELSFRQEPPGRNRPAAFTVCYKVSGPCGLPPRFEPVDPMERDGVIENGQNKADCSGVCHF
jgi:hypothetical protein